MPSIALIASKLDDPTELGQNCSRLPAVIYRRIRQRPITDGFDFSWDQCTGLERWMKERAFFSRFCSRWLRLKLRASAFWSQLMTHQSAGSGGRWFHWSPIWTTDSAFDSYFPIISNNSLLATRSSLSWTIVSFKEACPLKSEGFQIASTHREFSDERGLEFLVNSAIHKL